MISTLGLPDLIIRTISPLRNYPGILNFSFRPNFPQENVLSRSGKPGLIIRTNGPLNNHPSYFVQTMNKQFEQSKVSDALKKRR